MPLNAATDVVQGLRKHHMWMTRALWDVRRRYAESLLGPIWIAGGLATMSAVMGVLYAQVFGVNRGDILPHITAGFLLWYFISGVLNQSNHAFVWGRAAILHSASPFSPHLFRIVARELIVFAHNFGVYLVVAAIYGLLLRMQLWWALPGLALVIINVAWMGLMIACLATLYADVTPIVSYATLFFMFVTPLMWMPGGLGRGRNIEGSPILDYNPFYYLVTVVRDPLLGQAPELKFWVVCIVMAVVGWVVALAVFQATRHKLALAL